MKKLNLIHLKKVTIGVSLFFVLFLTYSLIFNLGPTVGVILSLVLKPTFKIEQIEFLEQGLVAAHGVTVSYKGREMVRAPKVRLEYSLNGEIRDWLKSIDAYDAEFFLQRDGHNINVVNAFSTGGNSKSGTGVPLRIIRVINGKGIFSDISYEHPIEKPISRLDGFVTFDRVMGIDLLFHGESEGSPLSFSFTNYFEDYSMRIKAKGISIDTNILQYAYYTESVNFTDGKGEIDLTIADSGLYGFAKIDGVTIGYDSFLEKAKNFTGEVKFQKDVIASEGNFDLFDKKRKLKLNYSSDSGLDLRLLLGTLTFAEVSHYKLLNSLGLERDLNFNDATVILRTDENRDFFIDVNTDLDNFELGGMYFNNIHPKITYNNSEDTINVGIKGGTVKILGVDESLDLNFKYIDDKGVFDYTLGSLEGNVGLFFKPQNLEMSFNSGFLVGKGNYDYSDKKIKFYNGKTLNKNGEIIYDLNTMNLEKFKGTLDINFLNRLHGKIVAKIENNKGELEKFVLTSSDEKEILHGSGEINLDKNNFKLDFRTMINYENEEFKSSIDGTINGRMKILEGKYQMDLSGEIDTIKYKDFQLSDIETTVSLNSDELNIKNLNNDKIKLQGKVNLTNNKLDLSYSIEGLDNTDVNLENIKFDGLDVVGKIGGTSKSPLISYNILSSSFYPSGEVPLHLKSKGMLKNNVFEMSELTLNNKNKFIGRYDLNDNTYSLQGNVLSENVPLYIDSKGFEYLVTGKVDIKGKGGAIKGNVNYAIENIIHSGVRLPNIRGNLTYQSENYTDGIIGIEYLTLVKNRRNVGTFRGNIDLKTRKMAIKLQEDRVNLRNIVSGNSIPSISGIGELRAEIVGTLDAPVYSFDLHSKVITINNVPLNEFKIILSGDSSKAKLDEFSFIYSKNKFESLGYYDLSKNEYSLNIFSKDIDLGFMNALTSYEDIDKVSGRSQMDLTFTNNGNAGFIKGKNLMIQGNRRGIDIRNLSYNIQLNDKRIEVKEFTGQVNGGELSLSGYAVVPDILEVKYNPNFYDELDYNFNLVTKGVKFSHPDHLFIVVDSNLEIASNKLTGFIKIVDGEIRRIPGVSEGVNIFRLFIDYITRIAQNIGGNTNTNTNTNTNNVFLSDNSKRENNFGNSIAVDLDFKIMNGIRLRMDSILGMMEDIRGEIIGGGRVVSKNGKYNFLGGFDWTNGSFLFNYLKFSVREGGITFHRENEFYPNFNPTIRFDSSATDRMNYFEIGLRGDIRNLNYRIRRNSELSSGRLSSLFSSDNETSGEAQNFLIKSILSNQISNLFFRPFLSEVRKVLRLSSLRAISTIEGVNVQSDAEREQNNRGYVFGIKLQAKKMLYENIYLVAEAGVTEAQTFNTRDTASSDSNSGSLNQYMLGVEYELGHGKYIGMGVSRSISNNSDSAATGRQENSSDNYYINFILNRRYDSFNDMIKNFF